jgi:hypothetical protein
MYVVVWRKPKGLNVWQRANNTTGMEKRQGVNLPPQQQGLPYRQLLSEMASRLQNVLTAA